MKLMNFKQLQDTATGTKFVPPHAILFMAALQEKNLENIELYWHIWWRYIDDIFFIWEHALKQFIKTLITAFPTGGMVGEKSLPPHQPKIC